MNKRNFEVTLLNNGVALKIDSDKYVLAEKYGFLDLHHYDLWTRVVDGEELKQYQERNFRGLSKRIKRVKSIKGYYFALVFALLGTLDLLIRTFITSSGQLTSALPWFLLAIYFGLPNFYYARDMLLDIFVRHHETDYLYLNRTYRFGSAVNYALNAYEDLGRVPTLDEARNNSKRDRRRTKIFDYYVGVSYLILLLVIIGLSIFALPVILSYKIFFIIVGVFVLTAIPFKLGVFDFMEKLTLETPTDEDIRLAIDAISLFDKETKVEK